MIFTKDYIDSINKRLNYDLVAENFNDQIVVHFEDPDDAYGTMSDILYDAYQNGDLIEIKLYVSKTDCYIVEYLDDEE
jgi:hypothetical protein